ncbi:hypothetical protein FUAX_32280 [Fulvitalea axinellae]|uniref:Uncharacterized protein n=1 Tax=Fulvitalea axinellae TaxID=1182444 RepID=A0AAU9DCC4_9BACT|nr:hypothetical protein FUAX_32280 [Fulvitalea axinellae]
MAYRTVLYPVFASGKRKSPSASGGKRRGFEKERPVYEWDDTITGTLRSRLALTAGWGYFEDRTP